MESESGFSLAIASQPFCLALDNPFQSWEIHLKRWRLVRWRDDCQPWFSIREPIYFYCYTYFSIAHAFMTKLLALIATEYELNYVVNAIDLWPYLNPIKTTYLRIPVQIHVWACWKKLNFYQLWIWKRAVCFLPHEIITFQRKK